MSEKKEVPAAIKFKNTGELPPLEFDWVHIMNICREGLQLDAEYVILPVEELQQYKPQRRRLLKEDKSSPKGLIQRDRYAAERYWPYASAKFNAEELIRYAADKFNALSAAEIESMAGKIISGIE